jgi:hypothetical protein
MTTKIMKFILTLAASAPSCLAGAQVVGSGAVIYPSNPTSADNIQFALSSPCNNAIRFFGNPYRVSMSQNNVTIALGAVRDNIFPAACTAYHYELFDIGGLPAGNYTVTMTQDPIYPLTLDVIRNVAFTVTDARASKAAPYVRADYSGSWWDPNDSGWGLFIWQDANDKSDSILAAWFTYTPDGKPAWFVFQPTWADGYVTTTADLLQSSRPPGPTSPSLGATTLAAVGKASLDFTIATSIAGSRWDGGRITYTLNGGPTITRSIRRFKP